MNHKKAKSQRLRLILAQAHRRDQAESPQPGPAWREGLMRRINTPRTAERPIGQWDVMGRLVWRLVPAAGAVALVLAILVSVAPPPEPTGQLAGLMTADSADSGLYSYYHSEPDHE